MEKEERWKSVKILVLKVGLRSNLGGEGFKE
jgi:hypothetical protein